MKKAMWIGDRIMPYSECLAAITEAKNAIDDVAKDKQVDVTAVVDKEDYTVVTQYRHKLYESTTKEHLIKDVISVMHLVQAIASRYEADANDFWELIKFALEDEDGEQ